MNNLKTQLSDLLRRMRLMPRHSGSAFDRFSASYFRACHDLGITNPAQIAYIFATIEHETAGTFKPVKEAYWLPESWRRKNLRYFPWYGRGFIQLTWQRNYQKVDDHFQMGDALIRNPDLLLEDYQLSLLVAVAGMEYGWFTGKKLDDYINPRKVDLKGARRIVNGRDRDAHIAKLSYKHLDLIPHIQPDWMIAEIEDNLQNTEGETHV